MLGRQERWQEDLFVAGSLRDLIPDDHILKRVDKVLDLSWLRDEVSDCYDVQMGRPGIDPDCRRGRRTRLRDNFDRLDGWVFDLTREHNAKLSISHFHRHGFDIGASGPAGLGPDVKVLECMPLHTE